MKKQLSPVHISIKSSDAVAIFKDGIIVFATYSFKELYNSLKSKERGEFNRTLRDSNRALQGSGEPFTHMRESLILGDKEIDISVYLLNIPGSLKDHLLVLAGPRGPGTDLALPVSYQPEDTDQVSSRVETKLSSAFSELIGEAPNFKAVLSKVQKAAQSDYPVLIQGESGTGKEILARMIHKTSRRNRKKFVDINCAAIPDQLIDSELFGYEKGAFTGASPGGRHGLFAEAHQGTLFFDEIGDASLQTQAKLLRVLNEGCFKRVGGTKNIEVDVRVISATNKDLLELLEEKRFRQDLFYRLNTITIHVPPLRERSRDIPLLANFFLMKHSRRLQRRLQFTPDCLEVMRSYSWPGNVRELKGVVDYMVTMATGSLITETYFPDFLRANQQEHCENNEGRQQQIKAEENLGLLAMAVQNAEKEVIREVLQQAKNKSEAIKILGTSRRTFYAKLKQYDLE
ncbi:MAG: sigma-54-dependent Fis family transcriptional regulator [Deltaproteobacteria bacterium]|nr:sigma-54-dependent Fis family transcriptional regulator [Deltaproteobacteria bacterium]